MRESTLPCSDRDDARPGLSSSTGTSRGKKHSLAGGRKLLRLHVQFSEAPFGVLDIGRAAHIAFLENDVYIRVLVWNIIKAHRLV